MAIRLGIETSDSDLEQRLQRIEAELFNRVIANLDGQENAVLRSNLTTPPRPNNVRFSNNVVGAITVSWDPIKSRDVRYYEVEVSNNLAFNNDPGREEVVFSYKVPNSQFIFPDAFDPEANWFVRVRTVNVNKKVSIWTVPLSTELGRAIKSTTFEQDFIGDPHQGIYSGSATHLSELTSVSGWTPTTNTAIYGITDIVWEKGLVLPFTFVEFYMSTVWYAPPSDNTNGDIPEPPPGLTMEVLRVHDIEDFENNPVLDQNYKIINTITLTFASNLGSTLLSTLYPDKVVAVVRQAVSGVTNPDDIAASAPFIQPGSTVGYRLRVTVDDNSTSNKNFIFFRPHRVFLEMVELRS